MLRAAALWLCLAGAAVAEAIPAGFNDDGINWLRLDEGLRRAKTEDKPVFLLVHATWCPRCREYREQFFDSRVDAFADKVVFVLIDQDQEEHFADQFKPDGAYIPRSMIVKPDGTLVPEINSGRDDYRYFLNTLAPDDLLRVLDAAVALK